MQEKKIKITKNGPYLVSGLPLQELIIALGKDINLYKQGEIFEVKNDYALCRCGKSSNQPFCDGTHKQIHFDGELTASKEPFSSRASIYEGENIVLEDVEELCAFARFCHSKEGNAWDLTKTACSEDEETKAIKMVFDCPSGRLVMKNKESSDAIEPLFEPDIVILQDPAKQCSGPLWVRGGVVIEDDKGYVYEQRNRVTLCRCGESSSKPFCDARHIDAKFKDDHSR